MDLKEQLLWLLLQDVSYHRVLAYYELLKAYSMDSERLTFSNFQRIRDYARDIRLLEFVDQLSFNSISYYYKEIKKLKSQCFTINDSIYPSLWKEIPQPPLLIFYQGALHLLNAKPPVSIIGTRNTTLYGRETTSILSLALAKHGYCVVSGLADGIDRYAHLAAMNYSESTIGIIASGYSYYYPRRNRQLQEAIGQNHLLLSEYLPQTGIKRHHFIMRNRLVAGLSPVTMVMEAANESGSLITANYALQFNREVLALPGRTMDIQAQGTNMLINCGAKPIISLNDTLEYLSELYVNQGYILKSK